MVIETEKTGSNGSGMFSKLTDLFENSVMASITEILVEAVALKSFLIAFTPDIMSKTIRALRTNKDSWINHLVLFLLYFLFSREVPIARCSSRFAITSS